MNELNLQIISSLKIMWIAIATFFYGLGGMNGKWKRRFVMPIFIMLGIFVISKITYNWSYLYLTYLPLLIMSLHLGYGSNDIVIKFKKRLIYGIALGIAPGVIAILNTSWILWLIHIVLCVSFSVLLGVFNPTKNARSEETLICLSSITLPFYFI